MKQLTSEQLDALQRFAAQMGRGWKGNLRAAWMTGTYPAGCKSNLLQQIRNSFGPSWLVRFSLPKPCCDGGMFHSSNCPTLRDGVGAGLRDNNGRSVEE